MKLIRFSAAALATLAALLLSSCESERVELPGTVIATITSLSLLDLLPASTLIVAAQPSQANAPGQSANEESPLPDGVGRDTAKKVCNSCHGSDIWAKQRHTRDEWSVVIDDMTGRGMNASDKDLDTVLDYLSGHFAPAKKDAPALPPLTN